MTIELITGTPGAGKTTYAVAERLNKEVGRVITFEADGAIKTVTRRLCVAGIGGLLVEHERLPHVLTNDGVSERVIEYFNRVDEDGEVVFKRLRGEPALEVPQVVEIQGKEYAAGCSLFNWWMWCEPGDLIMVDEVQYIVPRGTLGRKPPPYIALLEVHRHYGVDFLFVTQHPQLLDTTIRNLVGMHRHVRSVMGSSLCMVYAWDHASNTDRISTATKSQFLRRKEHYALFKSAAAHVAPPKVGRWALLAIPLLLLACWFLAHRLSASKAEPKPTAAVAATTSPSASPSPAPGGLTSLGGPTRSAQAADRDWPTYVAEPVRTGREPLDGRAVQWEGSYVDGGKVAMFFGLFVDHERVATLTLGQLNAMGYTWIDRGPCVGVLRFGQVERLVTCGKRAARSEASASPALPATFDTTLVAPASRAPA